MSAPESRIPHFEKPPLAGLRLFRPKLFRDERGAFVKTFHAPSFEAEGIVFDTQEEFYSTSSAGVIRGMHFQVPDRAHAKLVTCLQGRILDVVLDLRVNSPTYGQHWSVVIESADPAVLYVPVGFAHGFLSLTQNALVHYRCTTAHSPAHDRGIRWDSFGFVWPEVNPVISARDQAFPPLAGFVSTFST
ncbi:MAG: hypothetical protein RLZ98_250 [Pseudomonadota bacterium]|jgi:dTDP-4-dehydrorhamnose 3,5-epimerase